MGTIQQALNKYIDQERIYQTEGERGVANLCKVAETLGYRDPQRFGRQVNGTYIGSLLNFMGDNPGIVEAMFEWIGEQNIPEWKELLTKSLNEPIDE